VTSRCGYSANRAIGDWSACDIITKVFPCDVLEMTAWVPITASICHLDGVKRLSGYLEAVKTDNKGAAESMLGHDSCPEPSTL